ncbi:MAG: methyltransferase [Hyphomicrobiaceae bacterium]
MSPTSPSNPADPATTDDAFLGGRLHILQPAAGYRAGLDAVLLAAALAPDGDKPVHALDTGAGAGVVGLAVASRLIHARVTLVEADPVVLTLAKRNIERNGFADRCTAIERDLSLGGAAFTASGGDDGLKPGTFTHALSNPPFFETGTGTRSPTPYKAAAHQMPAGLLDRWIAFMTAATVHGGELLMIHQPQALARILQALDGRFGDIRILPVHSKPTAPANRILVRARKASRAPLSLLPRLVLHDASGAFHPAIEAVLRHAQPLPGPSDAS